MGRIEGLKGKELLEEIKQRKINLERMNRDGTDEEEIIDEESYLEFLKQEQEKRNL